MTKMSGLGRSLPEGRGTAPTGEESQQDGFWGEVTFFLMVGLTIFLMVGETFFLMVEETFLLIMAAVIIRVMIVTTVGEGVFKPEYLDDGGCVSAHVDNERVLGKCYKIYKIIYRTFGPDRSRSRMQSEERFLFSSYILNPLLWCDHFCITYCNNVLTLFG